MTCNINIIKYLPYTHQILRRTLRSPPIVSLAPVASLDVAWDSDFHCIIDLITEGPFALIPKKSRNIYAVSSLMEKPHSRLSAGNRLWDSLLLPGFLFRHPGETDCLTPFKANFFTCKHHFLIYITKLIH